MNKIKIFLIVARVALVGAPVIVHADQILPNPIPNGTRIDVMKAFAVL